MRIAVGLDGDRGWSGSPHLVTLAHLTIATPSHTYNKHSRLVTRLIVINFIPLLDASHCEHYPNPPLHPRRRRELIPLDSRVCCASSFFYLSQASSIFFHIHHPLTPNTLIPSTLHSSIVASSCSQSSSPQSSTFFLFDQSNHRKPSTSHTTRHCLIALI